MTIKYKTFLYDGKEIEVPMFPCYQKEKQIEKIISDNSFRLIQFTDEPPKGIGGGTLEWFISMREEDIKNLKECIRKSKKILREEKSKNIKEYFKQLFNIK